MILKATSYFRWNDSTLKNPLEASKTAWPVAHKESIFQPEFPITTDLVQKDFEIEETIAKGAFGEVYKVKKISEDKEYALKVLNKSQVCILQSLCLRAHGEPSVSLFHFVPLALWLVKVLLRVF